MAPVSAAFTAFPALKPAIISKVNVDISKIHILGPNYSGSKLTHFECPTGTIETVPGFEPAFKANVTFGADWFSMDADGGHGRVDFKGIAKTEDGHEIDARIYGIVEMAPEASKLFNLEPDMASVPFGHISSRGEYLTSDPKLKFLEGSIFVGNARVTVDEAGGVTVENRLSLLLPTTEE